MFLLRVKLWNTKNLFNNIKTVASYGLYRWTKLQSLFKQKDGFEKGMAKKSWLVFLKIILRKIFQNFEFEKSLNYLNIQLKKLIFSYKGLWHHLNLPVWGQRTKTNASTQRLLSNNPWSRHFVQRWNRWKFSNAPQKKKILLIKIQEVKR